MVPLFGAIPGGPELFIVALVLVLPLGVGVWVYNDATAHGMDHAPIWGLAVTFGFLLWLVPGVVLYLYYVYVREKEAGERGATA
ncbi:hypothetical protein ACFQE1_14300 [Halobium palmae]|uniref:Phospholipase_D-nuclease N-terminal n=1 Tax=Halobium palmae TaxID=1776492 RepID=A0ABD5S200_9EURY